jgi:hypothetical protein
MQNAGVDKDVLIVGAGLSGCFGQMSARAAACGGG